MEWETGLQRPLRKVLHANPFETILASVKKNSICLLCHDPQLTKTVELLDHMPNTYYTSHSV